jgi:sulfite oxidase
LNSSVAFCDQENTNQSRVEPGEIIPSLPTFTEEEVAKHNKNAERIWISYKNGVYDITQFIESHPGGNKILMAAGASAEPFWSIYTVHQNPEVYEMLESFRIGNLKKDPAAEKATSSNDAYQNEPKRHPLLKVLTQKPFNAETPKAFSVENIITPNELHFKRNHLPVPVVEVLEKYELEVFNEITGKKVSFKLDELKKKFKVYKIPVTLQCSGNKRRFMNEHGQVSGLMWDVNAISNAEWTGIKLRDLLIHCEVNPNDARVQHVQFEGLDKDPSGAPYAASIPAEKVNNIF